MVSASSLRELSRELREQDVALHLADIKGPVRDLLGRTDPVCRVELSA